MPEQPTTANSPEPCITDLLSFHALFLSVIRFAVEKHGGSLEKDPDSDTTVIDIPDWAEDACLQELGNLVGPGRVLHSYLAFLEE